LSKPATSRPIAPATNIYQQGPRAPARTAPQIRLFDRCYQRRALLRVVLFNRRHPLRRALAPCPVKCLFSDNGGGRRALTKPHHFSGETFQGHCSQIDRRSLFSRCSQWRVTRDGASRFPRQRVPFARAYCSQNSEPYQRRRLARARVGVHIVNFARCCRCLVCASG
jgi:hypothetical protein